MFLDRRVHVLAITPASVDRCSGRCPETFPCAPGALALISILVSYSFLVILWMLSIIFILRILSIL